MVTDDSGRATTNSLFSHACKMTKQVACIPVCRRMVDDVSLALGGTTPEPRPHCVQVGAYAECSRPCLRVARGIRGRAGSCSRALRAPIHGQVEEAVRCQVIVDRVAHELAYVAENVRIGHEMQRFQAK